jgi:uncharacterized protein
MGTEADMTTTDVALLAIAGLAAGVVNTVVGGGTLLSFPALLASGLPPLTANVTSIVALIPGLASGTVAYRGELSGQRRRATTLFIPAAVGAAGGCALLLSTDEDLFTELAPALVTIACILLLVQPRLQAILQRRTREHSSKQVAALYMATALGAFYIAYFGAAGGVLLLALLGLALPETLQRLNALRALLALGITTLAAGCYMLLAPVEPAAALVLAGTSLIGGHLGAGLARALPEHLLRLVAIAIGLTVAIQLL